MPNSSKGQGNQDGQSKGKGSKGGKQNTSNRGFASMDEEKQREIASKGGKASHGGGRSSGSGSKGGSR
jgi:hypothetical protein